MMIDTMRHELKLALKEKRQYDKEVIQIVIGALALKEKEKKAPLTEGEEFEVIAKEIKQMYDTIETAKDSRMDIVKMCQAKIDFLKKFLPQEMTEEEIIKTIKEVIESLGLTGKVSPSNKGLIMKSLMPIVKGKANGQLVNKLTDTVLSGAL